MTKEDKELLLKDLCARLPYRVKVKDECGRINTLTLGHVDLCSMFYGEPFDEDNLPSYCFPYLHPMSSMTAVEVGEYISLKEDIVDSDGITYFFETYGSIDWLNEHHFDYRGLIEKGLALEAPVDMYKTEE